jgi:YggT family protein
MQATIWLIDQLFTIYWWVIFAAVASSWLIQFGIINGGNPNVRTVLRLLYNLTEPVLRPIRNFLPNLGGIDISPIILLLALEFIRRLVMEGLYRFATGQALI